MSRPDRSAASSLLGGLLLALGTTVAASWIGRYAPVVQSIPGAAMVFSAALCFSLIGLALAASGALPERLQWRFWMLLGGVVALIGALALFGHVTRQGAAVDWPSLHQWSGADHPNPGQMSLPSAAAFVLAGATLALMGRVRATWQGLAVQGLTGAVIALGLAGTVGWSLDLHLAYDNYLFDRMPLPAALAFIVAGTGLWLGWRRLGWYRSRTLIADEGLHISLNAIALLAVMLTVTLAAGLGVVAHQIDATTRRQLLDSLARRAEQFRSTVELRAAQAEMIAANPATGTLLRALNSQPGDEKSAAALRAAAASLLPHGFSGIAFQNPAGRTWAEAGRFATKPELALALRDRRATLIWDDGFVLRVRLPVTQGDVILGWTLAEQRLHRLTTALEYVYDFAASGEVAVCGRRDRELMCYPQRTRDRAYAVPDSAASPMARALQGEAGVRVERDTQGVNVMAAYGPIGNLGLGLVMQVRTSEFYAPLRKEMYFLVFLLGGMVVAGTLLFYWRVAPLARRLYVHEQRLKLALDSSRSAIWDLDLVNGIVYLSEQWPVLLGEKPGTRSTPLDELYQLVHPEDLPQLQRSLRATLRSDDVPYDVEHRVRTPAGSWTWIHSVGRVVERDHRGRALRMIGVNTNIARRKQAESFIERRASRDEATGLPNRTVFTDRLQTAMARSRRAPPDRSLMAVLFLGVHEVGEIEDTMGKEAAGTLLKELAERLQECVRATDTIARIGSEEFTIILEELGLTEQACRIAGKIIATLRHRIAVGRTHVAPSASVGIAFYDGVIKVSAEDLVAKAQNAMHEARHEEPNSYRTAA